MLALLCGREGRVNRGVTNPLQVHTPHVAPISHTLGRTKLLCSVRDSNSQQPLAASPLAKGWEQQWKVLGDIHSITAADTRSDTESVSRPARKRHQGWHVTIQPLKWSGPCQFDCASSSREDNTGRGQSQ